MMLNYLCTVDKINSLCHSNTESANQVNIVLRFRTVFPFKLSRTVGFFKWIQENRHLIEKGSIFLDTWNIHTIPAELYKTLFFHSMNMCIHHSINSPVHIAHIIITMFSIKFIKKLLDKVNKKYRTSPSCIWCLVNKRPVL